MGGDRASISFFGYLATRRQHGYDHCSTFLIVFLIQNTQNRDARALHLKLDEVIHSMRKARNNLIDLENCTDEELDTLQREFAKVRNGSSREQVRETIKAPISPQ